MDDLFQNYDPKVRPTIDRKDPTTVFITLTLFQILDLVNSHHSHSAAHLHATKLIKYF